MTHLTAGIRILGLALGLAAWSPAGVRAQEFEGIVRIRLIDVDVDRAEAIRTIQIPALLDLPSDRLIQLKAKDGSPAAASSLRTYLIKGRLMRLEADEGDESNYTLINLDDGTIRMVNPEQETYREISIPELTRPLFPMLQVGGYMVRPLNLSRKINGIEATAYEAVAGDNVVRAWLTHDYPALTRVLEDLARSIPMPTATAEDRLLGLVQLGVPILVQLVDMDGTRLDDYQVQEIIALSPRPLDPRLFAVPEGYERVDH